ncbi:MAG TPA: glutamyl-tRNA reductase [Bryobacteraceae bacterium]|nr:glutamyl-tRNA reductase [Bryobacteraceae bacterium]
MNFHVTGLNHTTAPVEVRERLAFAPERLADAVAGLRNAEGLLETMVLSTCNRVEITATADDACDARDRIETFLSVYHNVERDWLRPYLYHFTGTDAIRHLFRVAASLDSMVVGEPQILGQLKSAYETARTAGTLSSTLESILTSAFRVAKRVRTETEIGQSAVSVSYAAVELARQIFGSLDHRKVLLIGAGKMSELAARHLARAGASDITVTNRSPAKASSMAEIFNARTVPYESFHTALNNSDVVITSSGAPHFVLTCESMRPVVHARKGRPMFLIDIAVPRNIEPSVNSLDGIFLYDIDDMQKVVESNMLVRQAEAEEAERIISEEVARMMQRLQQRGAAPLIVSLQQQLEATRLAEMERMRARLAPLTPEQRELIDVLTRGILNKIAHGPISELRRLAASPDGADGLEALRRAFRLDGNDTK